MDKLKKGMRKGNWRKLNWKEKALYRAAMAYTRPKKRKMKMARDIVNEMIVEKLLGLIERLKETKGMRICMGAFVKVLAKRTGLYLLAGDGAVKMKIGKYLKVKCGDS
jgi:hypothetical protein